MRLSVAGAIKKGVFFTCLMASVAQVNAQTDADAIMMTKNNFCVGGMYSYSSWKNYWEGTLKRDNQNLGTVSTQMIGVMGNYGISSKLNVLFSLPYVQTKSSAGTLHGQKGIQDLSLWVKWMPFEKQVGPGTLSIYGVAGLSFPASGYVCDYLPLSIGLRSTNVTLRAMADYQAGSFFATVSGSYVLRSNVKIDRTSYYTTEMHYSNKVEMPDAAQWNVRLGYRTSRMIAEALVGQGYTLGGFDITRNNMPFPSNKMNMTTAGVSLKYNLKAVDGLSLIAGGNYTLAGRNVGQATAVNGGIFYILAFKGHKKATDNTPKTL
ncbi:MAG: hypothetical protein ABIQ88_16395 [Chitinophagaceae bacterium]